jgi:hypothetical protein
MTSASAAGGGPLSPVTAANTVLTVARHLTLLRGKRLLRAGQDFGRGLGQAGAGTENLGIACAQLRAAGGLGGQVGQGHREITKRERCELGLPLNLLTLAGWKGLSEARGVKPRERLSLRSGEPRVFGRDGGGVRDLEDLARGAGQRRDQTRTAPGGAQRGLAAQIIADEEEDRGVRQRRRPEQRVAIAASQEIVIEKLSIDLTLQHQGVEAIIGRGGGERLGQARSGSPVELKPRAHALGGEVLDRGVPVVATCFRRAGWVHVEVALDVALDDGRNRRNFVRALSGSRGEGAEKKKSGEERASQIAGHEGQTAAGSAGVVGRFWAFHSAIPPFTSTMSRMPSSRRISTAMGER